MTRYPGLTPTSQAFSLEEWELAQEGLLIAVLQASAQELLLVGPHGLRPARQIGLHSDLEGVSPRGGPGDLDCSEWRLPPALAGDDHPRGSWSVRDLIQCLCHRCFDIREREFQAFADLEGEAMYGFPKQRDQDRKV